MIKKIVVIGLASFLMLSCLTGSAQAVIPVRKHSRHIITPFFVPRVPVYTHAPRVVLPVGSG